MSKFLWSENECLSDSQELVIYNPYFYYDVDMNEIISWGESSTGWSVVSRTANLTFFTDDIHQWFDMGYIYVWFWQFSDDEHPDHEGWCQIIEKTASPSQKDECRLRFDTEYEQEVK